MKPLLRSSDLSWCLGLILVAGLLVIAGCNQRPAPVAPPKPEQPDVPPTPTKSDNPTAEEKPALPAIFEPVELAAFDIPRNLDAAALSPDGKLLALGGENGETDLWDLAAKKIATTMHGHGKGVRAVAFSPDGATLASGRFDGTVRVWDVSAIGGSKK